MPLSKIFPLAFASVLSSCGGGGGNALTSNQPSAQNCYPTAAARPSIQEGSAGTLVPLKELASCDASTSVTYRWTLLSKPRNSAAALSATNSRTPSINPDLPGLYVLKMEETGATMASNVLVLVAQPAGTSPALAEHKLLSTDSSPKFEFAIKPNLNNQGIAFNDGYYYVGYDVTGGNGMIERYGLDGKLDMNYGRESVPTRHTAELAYRAADNSLYAVSGGGTEPTFLYRISQNGKAVDMTFDFTAYGSSGLFTIENTNDLLLLMTSSANGDKGDPTFRLIDLNNKNSVLLQFTIPNQGVPQGLEIADGIVYLYTNNLITMLDLAGNILGKKDLSISGESQGITLVTQGGTRRIAVGYQPGRIYSFTPK